MQHWELRVSGLIDHGAREHPAREVVTRMADGTTERTDWAGVRRDALKMVQALARFGLKPRERVATLAMNHGRHVVSWYGVAGAGGVVHTVNPRLFDDQLDYIVNHAEDRVLIYDAAFRPLVERMKPRWNTVEKYICFDDGEFDAWMGGFDGDAVWVEGSERDPCMLCYTSGTTGNPKGVLYEHRSNMLHTLCSAQPGAMNASACSVILPVVPMFHANNWGIPWVAPMVGAKLVYCQTNDPVWLCELMREEGVTMAAGVPTVWLSILQHLDAAGEELPPITGAMSGGSALPPSVISRLMNSGVRVFHAWGMTETSPVATMSDERADWAEKTFDGKVAYKALQGRAGYGSQVRAVSLDDPDAVLARDGMTAGALQVRGHWTIQRYFKAELDAAGRDGWFDTGDVALIHPDGTVQLTDRTKDVIKSGGEWISSVELENAAVAHPGVAEAAAIGIAHPRWDERPILVVVRKEGSSVTAEDLTRFLADRVAKWWLPDAVEFVDSIPHTGTGKISKKELRDRFARYKLADAEQGGPGS